MYVTLCYPQTDYVTHSEYAWFGAAGILFTVGIRGFQYGYELVRTFKLN